MRYFLDAKDGAVAQWVMDYFRRRATPPYQAIGAVDADGRLVAGVVFNGFNGANIDITIRAEAPITRQGLRLVFGYAFRELQCSRVTARVRRGKAADRNPMVKGSRPYMKRLGFQLEHCSPCYYGNGRADSAYVFRMLREDCPWIRGFDDGRPRSPEREGNGRRANGRQQANGAATAANRHGKPARPNGHAAV